MSIAVSSGLIILISLAIMLIAGVPIAVALGISSIAAILPILNTTSAVLTGAQRIFGGISVFSLLAIPFFILAGNLMNKGGIAIRLINLAKLLTGGVPGSRGGPAISDTVTAARRHGRPRMPSGASTTGK